MSEFKDVSLLLNESTYSEALKLSQELNITVDELINRSLGMYLNKFKKRDYIDDLIEGYQKFGEFNLNYAEMCLSADNEALALCEEKLSESE